MSEGETAYFKIKFSNVNSNHYLNDVAGMIRYKNDDEENKGNDKKSKGNDKEIKGNDEETEIKKTMFLKISIVSITPDVRKEFKETDTKTEEALVAFAKERVKVAYNCLKHGKSALEDMPKVALKIFNKGRDSLKEITKKIKARLLNIGQNEADTLLEQIDRINISLYNNLMLCYQKPSEWAKIGQIREFILSDNSDRKLEDIRLGKACYSLAIKSIELESNLKEQEELSKVHKAFSPDQDKGGKTIQEQEVIGKEMNDVLDTQKLADILEENDNLLEKQLGKTSDTESILSHEETYKSKKHLNEECD